MNREDQFEEEEDEWDPQKKHYLKELKRSNFEKWLMIAIVSSLLASWFAFGQAYLLQYPFFNSNASHETLSKYLGKNITIIENT